MQEGRHSTIAGFALPAGLDVRAYDDVGKQAARLANPNDSSRTQKKNAFVAYAGAWNGFVVRFSAAVSASIRFSEIISTSNPGFPEMLERDRVLFECICSLASAFECIYFAAYCIAAEVNGSPVVLDQPRDLRVYAQDVVSVYRTWMSAEPLTDELERFATSVEYGELKGLRDVLAHRGNVPQLIRLTSQPDPMPRQVPSNPKDLALQYVFDVDLASNLTSQKVEWLAIVFNSIAQPLATFLARQEPR